MATRRVSEGFSIQHDPSLTRRVTKNSQTIRFSKLRNSYNRVIKNHNYFIADSLVEPIKKKMRTRSDGSKAECYVITTKSFPTDHEIGPRALKHVTDDDGKGGIWIKDGHVYNVSSEFVAHLDKDENVPKDLDECSGHDDDVRGYHITSAQRGITRSLEYFAESQAQQASSNQVGR